MGLVEFGVRLIHLERIYSRVWCERFASGQPAVTDSRESVDRGAGLAGRARRAGEAGEA